MAGTRTPALARHIEIWPVDRLIPYARNPRTHSKAQIAQIAASILEFGFTNPILVDSKDGIIAGHGRLLGAREVGLKEVPVVILDHLTDAQRRAYIIADNKLAENAGWDDELLALELKELNLEGFDLALTGFDEREFDALLQDDQPVEGEDDLPEPGEPVTQRGRRLGIRSASGYVRRRDGRK